MLFLNTPYFLSVSFSSVAVTTILTITKERTEADRRHRPDIGTANSFMTAGRHRRRLPVRYLGTWEGMGATTPPPPPRRAAPLVGRGRGRGGAHVTRP